MNTIRVLAAVAIFAALISAQDLSLSPAGFSIYEQTNTWTSLYVTNNMGVSATAVSFKCYPASVIVSASYPNSGSSSVIGTINSAATGAGSFALVASSTGSYSLGFSVSYKKSGVSKVFNGTLDLEVVPQGSKREVSMTVNGQEFVVDEAVEERSELFDRDTYVTITTNGVSAYAGESTWDSIGLAIGSVQCNNISFTVTPVGSGVAISYAYPNGNYIGTGPANTNVYGSFNHLADCGYYNLNVSVQYKLQGTSTFRKIWKIILLSVIGDGCQGGDTASRRGSYIRADMENASANGFSNIPAVYAVAAGIAGVALVAVFSVVGTVALLKRRNQETIVA